MRRVNDQYSNKFEKLGDVDEPSKTDTPVQKIHIVQFQLLKINIKFKTLSLGGSNAMWETWVQFLGWEDPLEKGMTTHSNILAWRILMDRGAWWATAHGVTENQTRLSS